VYEGDLLEQRLTRNGVRVALDSREPLALQAESVIRTVVGEGTEDPFVPAVAPGADGARAVAIALLAAHTLAGTRVTAAE
jgi:hypothetical protein